MFSAKSWLTAGLLAWGLVACSSGPHLDEAAQRRLVAIHTELAAGYLQRDQLEVAQDEIDQALALNSDDSQANNVMALLQARLKNYDKADKYFRKALSAQPDNAEAQNNYGVFLCEQKRVDEAEKHFNLALKNPFYRTPEIANINAGLCLMKKGASEAAARYFRNVLVTNPKQPMALMQMAKINLEAGNALSARGYLQRYFEVAKDSPDSLLLAYRVEHALKNRDMQASYATRLVGKFPDSAEARLLKQLRE